MTTSSACLDAAVSLPWLAMADVSVSATARPTASGTCDPPGPSKCAAPLTSAGKCLRTDLTS